MKRFLLVLSFLMSTSAFASTYVVCDIGMEIMYQGKPNHLNLVNVRGILMKDDADSWLVNFKYSLPTEYTYLEGPELLVNNNSCVYEKVPEQLD